MGLLLTDLQEIKSYLEIDVKNTNEDKKLNWLMEMASDWVAELIGRVDPETGKADLEKKSRTEYYKGTGTQKLLLKHTPVFNTPTIQVFLDEGGNFGTTSGSFDSDTTELDEGDDWVLDIKEDGVPSQTGILWRIGNLWARPNVRQRGFLYPFIGPSLGNIKVVYTGGYTIDNIPTKLRLATLILVAQLRYLFPLGVGLSSESYEDRSISVVNEKKDYLLGMVKPLLWGQRTWKFGSQ